MAGDGFLKSVTIILMLYGVTCQGSKLTLTVEPSEPKELTTPLEITCTFEEMTIGQDGPTFYYLDDLFISNGENAILATISLDKLPEVKLNKDRMRVEGQLSSKKSGSYVKPYLKLMWKRSLRELSGRYTCLAYVHDEEGRESLLLSEKDVAVQKPSLDDVWQYLSTEDVSLERMGHNLKLTHEELASTIERLSENVRGIQSSIFEKEQEIEAIKLKANTQFEMGEVQFKTVTGNEYVIIKDVWATKVNVKEQNIQFRTPFDAPPILTYSVDHFDGYSFDPRMRYQVTFYNLTRHGFIMKCHTWKGTVILSLHVAYTAFGR